MLSTALLKISARLVPEQVNRQSLTRWTPLPLRLIVGFGFMMHGYAKFSRGPENFALVLQTIGVPLPVVFAWMTTLVESIGGVTILLGAFVPMASLPMAIVLLTALFTIHLPYGFFSVKLVEVTQSGTKFGPVGYEIVLLYLAGLATLALGGAGPFSIDQWRSGAMPNRKIVEASRRTANQPEPTDERASREPRR